VDDGATNRAKGWDHVLTDNVLTGDRDVFNTIDEDPADVSADGCEKTANDAHAILSANCGGCHNQGPASFGAPLFDFVMDDAKLTTSTWTRQGTTVKFVTVGDADNSAIFQRAAIARDMPPLSSDIRNPELPRVTFSGASVLRQWIDKCM